MKQVSILITATSAGNYNLLIAAGTPQEKFFEGTDGVAGLKGRLTAIGDSLNQYLSSEPEPTADLTEHKLTLPEGMTTKEDVDPVNQAIANFSMQ